MIKRVLLTLLMFPLMAFADISDRPDVQAFIQEMSKEYQFSPEALTALFKKVDIQESIIDAMNRPAEGKPWYEYRPLFVSHQSINNGVAYYNAHKDALLRAEKQYGVPASIIVAIIGVETRYGRVTGNYRVIEALSTLAFDYPKRAPFFRQELKEYLLLTREEKIDPMSLKGSYAGAMGTPQFMPSSYRKYAVDFTGDGKRNLWTNDSDAIGSVANYFKGYGWQTGAPVAFKLTYVPNANSIGLDNVEPNTPIGKLRAEGVKDLDNLNDNMMGTLLGYQLEDKKEIWLGLHNFYVITRYNKSPQYALAVYELGQAIEKRTR
ncbi:MAG: lytic murein transglycosylase B [Gammaproteobacteria bacterium]